MGGDNAPQAIVEGCLQALEVNKDFSITLIGERRKIEDQLIDKDYDKERLTIKHASEVITNNEVPTKAIKKKTDSSMVVGFNMLKNREGDVFVSAGSSGALLAGSVFILRRIRGISRPALGSIIPTKRGRIILLDSGLNSVIRPQNYLQFAYLGAAYMKSMFGVEDPRVGLVNVGTEEEKGTEAVKEANTLLRQSTLNYIGFIEGKDVFEGIADVVVTDGFTGNVMLKLIEGTATYFFREVKGVLLRNWKSRIGAAFLKKGFEDFKKSMDPDVNGGAPILGVDGLVIKSHGSSNARTIKHVILKAVTLAESDFISDIKKEIKNM
jgi:glycerol-3-phosphate acyltransferase PlsX